MVIFCLIKGACLSRQERIRRLKMSSLSSGVSIAYTVVNGSFSTSDLKAIASKFFPNVYICSVVQILAFLYCRMMYGAS